MTIKSAGLFIIIDTAAIAAEQLTFDAATDATAATDANGRTIIGRAAPADEDVTYLIVHQSPKSRPLIRRAPAEPKL